MNVLNLIPRLFIIISTLQVLVLISPTAIAGANGSGGAHTAEDGQLLDLWENKGTSKLNPLEVYGVQEALQEIEAKLPGFVPEMKQALAKKWYLEPKAILDCPGGESIFDVKRRPVACQNKFEIRIAKKWWNTPPKISKNDLEDELYVRYIGRNSAEALRIKQQATVLHELLRNLRLSKSKSTKESDTQESEEGLRYLVRVLVPTIPDETELQDVVERTDFGRYSRKSYVDKYNAYLKAYASSLYEILQMTQEYKELMTTVQSKINETSKSRMPINKKFQELHDDLTAQFNNRSISQDMYLTKTTEILDNWRAELKPIGDQIKILEQSVFDFHEKIVGKLNQLRDSQVWMALMAHREFYETQSKIDSYLRISCRPSADSSFWDRTIIYLNTMWSMSDVESELNYFRKQFLVDEPRAASK